MVTTKPLKSKKISQEETLSKEIIKSSLMLQGKIVELVKTNNELLKAQTNSSDQISSMVKLFKEAGEHMVAETEEEKLRPLLNKISELVEQNKTIMRGLILIQKYIKSTSAQEIQQRPLSPEEF
jgi:molecular chaperone DnaK (HSP70)